MLKRKLENTSVRENAEDDEIASKEKKTSAYFVSSGPRLVQSDYNKPCVDLAKFLLGKMLCRQCPDTGLVIRAKIVEVESYPGPSDWGQSLRQGSDQEKWSNVHVTWDLLCVLHLWDVLLF